MRRIKYFIILGLSLLLVMPRGNVLANTNIVDFSKKGTITLELKESTDKTSVSSAEVSIYLIARATEVDNNLVYEYVDELRNCQVELTSSEIDSDKLVECTKDVNLTMQKGITDKKGIVVFNNLELGLYLVKQTNKLDGYSSFSPFLVMLPQDINNSWVYEVMATPKTDIIKLIDLTVKKVWNNSKNTKIPDSINIQLLKGREVIDEITLNNDNNWTYVWNDIEKSDEYSVKEVNIPLGYTVSYRNDGYIYIVTNTDTLIKTGQSVWLIELLALLGVLSIAAGLINEKRNNNEEGK